MLKPELLSSSFFIKLKSTVLRYSMSSIYNSKISINKNTSPVYKNRLYKN